jgi:hypothetical protein
MKTFLAKWVNKAKSPEKVEPEAPSSTDNRLPDKLYIPADCPNDVESIKACIDSQLIRRDAA